MWDLHSINGADHWELGRFLVRDKNEERLLFSWKSLCCLSSSVAWTYGTRGQTKKQRNGEPRGGSWFWKWLPWIGSRYETGVLLKKHLELKYPQSGSLKGLQDYCNIFTQMCVGRWKFLLSVDQDTLYRLLTYILTAWPFTSFGENRKWLNTFLSTKNRWEVDGKKIRSMRSDRGGEYLRNSWTSHLKHRSVVHELTAAYTQHQNRTAKRVNRTPTT